jgi:putative protein kinase ArgK-like GTPase of G3E family
LQENLTVQLGWVGLVYRISAVTGEGCTQLTNDIMERLTRIQEEKEEQEKMEQENRESEKEGMKKEELEKDMEQNHPGQEQPVERIQ